MDGTAYSTGRTSSAEEWRPAPGLEGRYEVSDQGRARATPGTGRVAFLKINYSGRYPRFSARVNGRQTTPSLHRLICEAFHGPAPTWAECARHLNDDPRDNRAVNLAWGTHADNMQDRIRNGGNPELRRTACDNGHPYVEGSFSINRGARRCLVCHRAGQKAREERRKAHLPKRRCPATQLNGNPCPHVVREAAYCSRHRRNVGAS